MLTRCPYLVRCASGMSDDFLTAAGQLWSWAIEVAEAVHRLS